MPEGRLTLVQVILALIGAVLVAVSLTISFSDDSEEHDEIVQRLNDSLAYRNGVISQLSTELASSKHRDSVLTALIASGRGSLTRLERIVREPVFVPVSEDSVDAFLYWFAAREEAHAEK